MNEIFKVKSGYSAIDKLVDFRSGSTYLVAGYKKSGKSSFLLGIVNFLLNNNYKVAYFDTELMDSEFYIAQAAQLHKSTKSEIEEKSDLIEIAKQSFEENFHHFDPKELSNNGVVDFELTMKKVNDCLDTFGIRIFVFDNLTTYMGQAQAKEQGWQILQNCATRIKDFGKINNVLCFIVVHTKDTVIFNETPQGIRNLVEEGKPQEVFTKSITVIKKPSGADIYGGSSYQGQMSGTVLIWRPFQQYDLRPDLQKMTQIILEDFRHHSGGSARFLFDGEKGIFEDDVIGKNHG